MPNETDAQAVTRLEAEVARVTKLPADQQGNLASLRRDLAAAKQRVADNA